MIEVSRLVCLGILTGVSAADVCFRKVPSGILILMNVGAMIYQLILGKEDICLITGGVAAGIGFLLISKVTREGIGYGDSLGILSLGIYLGVWKLLEVLAISCAFLCMGAMILLVKKRMARRCTLPFYPFLTVGYSIWMAIEAGI